LWGKLTPLLLILALVVGGGAWYKYSGSYEVVPPVAALTVDEATVILAPLELGVEVVEEFSEDIPAGDVIRTDPASGDKARKGSPVTLIVSKGQERYLIPSDFSGKDPVDVTSALVDLTLIISSTQEVFDELVPVGKVVSTNPIGGTSVKRETPVTILVSKGPDLVDVPNVVGMSTETATSTLQTAGFQVKAVNKLPVAIFNKVFNKVYSQKPGAGSKSPKGSVITIEIV